MALSKSDLLAVSGKETEGSMMKLITFALISLCLALVADAAVLHVNKNGTTPYVEVQSAIDASSPSDTIVVAPSAAKYTWFTVDKTLTVIGAGIDTIPGQATIVEAIHVNGEADNTVLSGLWITTGDLSNVDSGGTVLVVHSGVQDVLIRNCFIENTINGTASYHATCAWLGYGTRTTFLKCCFWPWGTYPDRVYGLRGSGIAELDINSCVFATERPIYVNGSGSLTVRHSILLYCDYGIEYNGPGSVENCVAIGNTIHSSAQLSYNYCACDGEAAQGIGNLVLSGTEFAYVPTGNPRRCDFHLSTGSELIDAGNPISPPDRDGSRADIGIYGGQNPYDPKGIPDFPFVIELEIPASVPQNGTLHIGSTGRVGSGN
jgi:hypothetical protein